MHREDLKLKSFVSDNPNNLADWQQTWSSDIYESFRVDVSDIYHKVVNLDRVWDSVGTEHWNIMIDCNFPSFPILYRHVSIFILYCLQQCCFGTGGKHLAHSVQICAHLLLCILYVEKPRSGSHELGQKSQGLSWWSLARWWWLTYTMRALLCLAVGR